MKETNEKEKEGESKETTKTEERNKEDDTQDTLKGGNINGDNKPHKVSGGKVAATYDNDLSHVTSFEDLLDIVGTRGRFSMVLFFLCSYTSFLAALQTLPYQFLGATPTHWCRIEPLIDAGWTQEQILSFAIPLDENGKHESCLMYDRNYTLAADLDFETANATFQDAVAPVISCYARDFNRSQYQSTVTTEWDLVCERRALYSTTQAAAEMGKLVGYIFLGYLIDTYGRRLIVLISSALCIFSGLGAAVAPNVQFYIFLRVAITIGTSGIFLSSFILMMETCGTKERTKTSVLSAVGWATGYLCIPLIAYFIRTWKWLQAAYSLPMVVLISYYWLFPESPRWLILQGRYQEALNVLRWAAKINKRTLPPEHALLASMQRLCAKVSAEQATTTAVPGKDTAARSKLHRAAQWMADLLKKYLVVLLVSQMRRRALVVSFCWFTSGMVYYGISLNATNISVNVYLYVLLGGILEFPSFLFLWPLVAYFGRVKSLVILYSFCGAAILMLALFIHFFPEAPTGLLMFLSLTGKIGISAGFGLIWIFTPELFPTRFRSLITGQASVIARIGSVSAPYINDLLGEIVVWAPSAVFCVLSLLAGGLSFLLPETKGRGMPEGYSFDDKPSTKGSVNQAYMPDPESPSTDIPIGPTNKDSIQPDTTSDEPTNVQTKV